MRSILLTMLLLLLLPTAGALFAEYPWALLFEFPPRTLYINHADFSMLAFSLFLTIEVALLFPVFRRLTKYFIRTFNIASRLTAHDFPIWGWLGLMLMVFSWILAWNRFEVLGALQAHTYFPLWISLIIVLNAVCKLRTGISPPQRFGLRYYLLFPYSSAFWWSFEYLNRFVQNWTYENVGHFSSLEYLIYASLSFSTVLPAVLAMKICLASFPCFNSSFNAWKSIVIPSGLILVSTSALILFFLPIFPNELFPFVWVAPLLLIVGILKLDNRSSLLSRLEHGDWRETVVWAFAALLCGFFWEMWNYYSYSRWVYHVPYVGIHHIFEMPFLGYFGYLPFGIFCAVVTELFLDYRQGKK